MSLPSSDRTFDSPRLLRASDSFPSSASVERTLSGLSKALFMRELTSFAGAALVFVTLGLVAGCGSSTRRFPLRDPLLVDNDTRSVRVPCHKSEEDPSKV